MANCSLTTSEMCLSQVGFPNMKILLMTVFSLTGIQGSDIGDVKFNADGDGLGRYSVYQYQEMEGLNKSQKVAMNLNRIVF